jgi:choline dehydrogenase-like flavoprotein
VNVIGFHMVPSANGRQRVDGFSYMSTVDGTTSTQGLEPGDILVLANTPMEAVRLSLVSNGNSRWEKALDRSGQLGQNLMFHLQSDIICITDRNIHSWRGRTSTHTLDAFAGAGPRPSLFDPAVPRGGILEIGGNQNPITEASDVASFLTGSALKAYMQLGPFSKRLTTFTMQGEDMPQQSNAVDLDLGIVDVYGQPVPRVTYKSHPYELAAAAAYAPRMLEIMEAIGGPGSRYPGVRPLFAANLSSTLPAVLPSPVDSQLSPVTSATPLTNIPSSRHILGTHRMALDPELGPCDPFGRYWNVDNLYHVGGGLYVTAPGYNVTLTMWALSYWVGAALLKGVGNRTTAYTSADIDDAWPALASVIHEQDGDTMIGQLLTGNFQAYKQRFPEEDRDRWF